MTQHAVAGAFLALLLGLGCGGDDRNNFVGNPNAPDAEPPADAAPDAEPVADADVGAPDAEILLPDGAVSDLGPVIEVLAPLAETGFVAEDMIATDRFTARCRVTQNATTLSPVDTTSVRMTANVGGTAQDTAAQPTSTLNEFEADFNVAAFPNGTLSVRCTASDTEDVPNTNSEAIATFLDLGPAVTVFNPLEGASFANQLDVLFRVEPDPVDGADTGADIGTVRLFVGTVEILPLTGPDENLNYTGVIVFDDPAFLVPLDGEVSMRIEASNTRTVTPVTRIVDITFIADNEGPTIAINDPTAGELVSGIFAVTATITDISGVDPLSVVATIGHDFEITLTAIDDETFGSAFDSRILDPNFVFPPIEVRAKDFVGNQASLGQVIGLDNVPPLLDLDPDIIREGEINADTGLLECSDLFDPLGDDAIDDGETVAQLSEIRVMMIDRGNLTATDASGVAVPQAGIKDDTVVLYVLDDELGALLVDTDGDTFCDEINPDLVPTSVPVASNEAAVLDLVAVPPQGSSFFDFDIGALTGFDADCTPAVTPDLTPPDNVCVTVQLTRVIQTEIGKAPMVYGIPPLGGISCLGNGYDALGTNIADGYACVAVRAEDGVGNVGVSPPHRVCFDSDQDGAEGCPIPWGQITAEGARPACTDGCTPSPGFASFVTRIDL